LLESHSNGGGSVDYIVAVASAKCKRSFAESIADAILRQRNRRASAAAGKAFRPVPPFGRRAGRWPSRV